MPHRLPLVLLLACLSFPLMAKDVRQLGPGGGGGCDDPVQADESATPGKTTASPAARPRPAAQPRSAAPRSDGDSGNDLRPPRWHSFLPGMFR